MKNHIIYFITILFFFSIKSLGQLSVKSLPVSERIAKGTNDENITEDNGIIIGYHVKEIINMSMGKRIVSYQVSKLSLIDNNDLGPNNTRTITPIYKRSIAKNKEKNFTAGLLKDTPLIASNPKEKKVIDSSLNKDSKYLTLDLVKTYTKVLNTGYRSIDMMLKVADKAYFDGDFRTAAKYYAELYSSNAAIDESYYYRYSQSLKEIKNLKKADEIMKLYEDKKLSFK